MEKEQRTSKVRAGAGELQMSAHTPGPWWVGLSADRTPLVYTKDLSSVAHIYMRRTELARQALVEETDANARLIAAAPDLLAAAQEALALLREGANGWGVSKDILNAAIAKATAAPPTRSEVVYVQYPKGGQDA